MHTDYLSPAIRQLRDQQVRFAPYEKQIQQADSAEKLLNELDSKRTYTWKYVCHRVTNNGYASDPDLKFTGEERERARLRKIFSRYGIESGGFEISPEITFKAWFATRRIAEVDVRHLKRSSGQSSFSFLRAGPGYAKILFKAFINRLTGRWFTLDW